MGITEDVLAEISEVLGENSAEQVVKNFDDPKKYTKEFLDEYLDFMQKLIGDVAERKAALLYKKYGIKHEFCIKSPLPA